MRFLSSHDQLAQARSKQIINHFCQFYFLGGWYCQYGSDTSSKFLHFLSFCKHKKFFIRNDHDLLAQKLGWTLKHASEHFSLLSRQFNISCFFCWNLVLYIFAAQTRHWDSSTSTNQLFYQLKGLYNCLLPQMDLHSQALDQKLLPARTYGCLLNHLILKISLT